MGYRDEGNVNMVGGIGGVKLLIINCLFGCFLDFFVVVAGFSFFWGFYYSSK